MGVWGCVCVGGGGGGGSCGRGWVGAAGAGVSELFDKESKSEKKNGREGGLGWERGAGER